MKTLIKNFILDNQYRIIIGLVIMDLLWILVTYFLIKNR